ncbi:branched-chain amino acid ABC transporter permease [Candidatus Poribacteria bacterium]|nr:MAG: branched-chain amino acid ABC transporter permease [Candidatus Poribacteria bacterium]
MTLNLTERLANYKKPKNIILFVVICFLPGLTYLLDYTIQWLSLQGISVPTSIPSGDYLLRIIVWAGIYMLLAVGLNIVCGFTGLLDLGYVGFYLVGGYTAGLLMTRLGVNYWLVLPIAVLNGALWGLLRGAPTLRLTGDYFAIVTFGFAELLFRIIKNWIWLTGGPNGFVHDIPPPTLFGIVLDQNWHNYYHILVLLALVVLVTYRLQHSRVGRAWIAIREDEQAAESMGINLSRYKSLAFAVSAAIGALGGAFFAQFRINLSANAFEFWESIFILCMVVLGGMGGIKNAIIGAAILASLGEILRISLPYQLSGARYLIFGIILIALMRFRPDGLIRKA